MNIGIVSRFLPEKDGIAIYTENLINGLKKIKVIKIGTKSSLADYKIDFDSVSLYRILEKIIEKEKLDALHIQYIAPWYGKYTFNYPFVHALKKIKIPKIVTLHEVQYSNKGLKNKILISIERKIVNYSDVIVTHTPFQADFINRKYKVTKAVCIYMGVELKEVHTSNGKNVLFFGMISEGKGVADLIESKKYLSDFTITIAGRPISKTYEKKLKKLPKSAEVNFKFGWISENEKDLLYRKSNIVVLPYRWAPYQSAVLHDAVSYNLPVVVTKTGAIWELVDKFKLGEVVQPGKPEQIAKGIRAVLDKYKRYKKGVELYRKEANWTEVGIKYVTLYKNALK